MGKIISGERPRRSESAFSPCPSGFSRTMSWAVLIWGALIYLNIRAPFFSNLLCSLNIQFPLFSTTGSTGVHNSKWFQMNLKLVSRQPQRVKPSPYPWKPETRSCPSSRSCIAPSAIRTGSPTPAPRNGRRHHQMWQGPETTGQAQLGPNGGLSQVLGCQIPRKQMAATLWPGSSTSSQDQSGNCPKTQPWDVTKGSSQAWPLFWHYRVRTLSCLVLSPSIG